MKEIYLLDDEGIEAWNYTKNSNNTIAGVNDPDEFRSLMEAFHVMGFSTEEQVSILRVIAAVLHIGNIDVVPERRGGEDARLPDRGQAERVSHVLGIPVDAFVKGLLKPRVKAGREWVNQSRTAEQVKQSLDALAKALYERGFGKLVEMVNSKLDTRGEGDGFIGVLDIAGFEIFEVTTSALPELISNWKLIFLLGKQVNSFEQLCINYTNEKLQQFFNHHMFVLEQEEYEREKIEWKFIDFGHDLQPTIDLIELSNVSSYPDISLEGILTTFTHSLSVFSPALMRTALCQKPVTNPLPKNFTPSGIRERQNTSVPSLSRDSCSPTTLLKLNTLQKAGWKRIRILSMTTSQNYWQLPMTNISLRCLPTMPKMRTRMEISRRAE